MGQSSAVLISLINTTDNLGLKYVHSALLARGIESHILFHTAEDDSYFCKTADFIRSIQPNVVGISLMSRFFYTAVGLTQAIKRACGNDIPVVWGGIHPTIDPKGCDGHADYICLGEGESVLSDFVESVSGTTPKENLQGITRCGAQEYTYSPVVENLDHLAFPDVVPTNSWVTDNSKIKRLTPALVKKHSRHNGTYLPVMTSRGCPFSCTYCCNNLLHKIYGKQIRSRSPENVIEEIESNLAKSQIKFNYLNVYDDCFTAHSLEWLETFVRNYRSIKIPLVFRAIPQFITKEKIEVLKEAPCGFALIGLQSGSDRTLTQVYQRKHSDKAFRNCVTLLDQHNIPAIYDIIVDNPYETVTDVKETVKLVGQLPRTSYLSLASLTFYKYTALYEKAKNDGIPVDEHLTKNQDCWNKKSREVRAIRMAAFLKVDTALASLNGCSGYSSLKFKILNIIVAKLMEPLRYLKLMYLSHGRRILPFLGLLADHARDYGKRYFSFEAFNKHAH